jgi:phospholipid-binding lipoprotein MlaA
MPRRIRPLDLGCILAASVALAGCATVTPAQRDPRDPWQGMNRATFRFDLGFYNRVLKPVVHTYVRITPQPVRTGVDNFLSNLFYPTVIVNALLQGKVVDFARDTGRMLVDTTLGIGGLFDPATPLGLPREDRDFGQTFGRWGVPTGPYLVLPILGPSDVRDALGLIPDYAFMSPLGYGHYAARAALRYGTDVLDAVHTGVSLLPAIRLTEQAYDPYAFARHAYLQQRKFMVEGQKAEHGGAEQELKELEQSSNPQ